jgi:hypothetical protein
LITRLRTTLSRFTRLPVQPGQLPPNPRRGSGFKKSPLSTSVSIIARLLRLNPVRVVAGLKHWHRPRGQVKVKGENVVGMVSSIDAVPSSILPLSSPFYIDDAAMMTHGGPFVRRLEHALGVDSGRPCLASLCVPATFLLSILFACRSEEPLVFSAFALLSDPCRRAQDLQGFFQSHWMRGRREPFQ